MARGTTKEYISLVQAQANSYRLDWTNFEAKRPNHLGVHTLHSLELEKLLPFFDWTPFFRSWDLHGKYPALLNDAVVGSQAQALFEDAQRMLEKIVTEKWITAKARFGIFPVNSVGDDIEIYTDEKRAQLLGKWITLRQQLKKTKGQANLALADFIAPKALEQIDYMGAFCVSTGFGTEEKAKAFEAEQDDYSSIMVKALSDRFAEAFAEYLHHQIRTNYWGYAAQEGLTNEELIAEKYQGIRPAPGYPACPDHLEKKTLWNLLEVEKTIGVSLTESLAMWPASSVSGYYFAHPESRYFGLGKIKEDQLLDYSKRRGIALAEAKKWLNPNLAD